MVKLREDSPFDNPHLFDSDSWLTHICNLANLDAASRPRLQQAFDIAEESQAIPTPEPLRWGKTYNSFKAGLDIAEMLAELHLDEDSLVAAIVYRAVREGKITDGQIEKQFGTKVLGLIDGVRRMAAINSLSNHTGREVFGQQSQEQAENVRRMLVAIVDDVRVALIKLAERTCAIREVKSAPMQKRQRVAREVADVYAPLSHRLGIGHIKWELEDLAFRYLQPYDYKYIAKLLDERRVDREVYIQRMLTMINAALDEEGIEAEVTGRVKHIYSIWRKMRRKNISFDEVYDVRAVRILVNSERECYTVLGIIHALWRNVPNEFDDYVATPKENGYRSLHTAVKGPENRILEVQIRTHEMHDEAEFGVCAHWLYKDADGKELTSGYEQKIEWLRQVLEWHEEVGSAAWDDQLQRSIEHDRIYVFTPEGHVIDLPEDATPVDFAFRIHSDVGLVCRGAKVNGRIVTLHHKLKTADQVEILTGKHAGPSRDWLNSALGYITTSRARSCLQHWFKQQDRDQNIADGRAMLDHEFKRLAVADLDYEKLTEKLNLRSLEDLYAAVGTGDLGVERVINTANRLVSPHAKVEPVLSLVAKVKRDNDGADVYVSGVGNMMTHFAQCCRPIPGDSIVGYITLGRGVSIHRQDCENLLQNQNKEPERVIAVDWAAKPRKQYSADIVIDAFDRHGLLRDITTLLDRERINVSAMKTFSNKDDNTVDMVVTVEVTDFNVLSRALAKLNQLPNITSARRSQ